MDLPPPKDLTHHYSRVVQRAAPSEIKRFYKYFSIPGIANLAGGLPNPHYFPFDTLEARVAPTNRFKLNHDSLQQQDTLSKRAELQKQSVNSYITVPHDSSEPDQKRKIDIATALQYGRSLGFPPLHDWIREFTRTKLHPNAPYRRGPEIVPTMGSTDGFTKLLHAFTDTWDNQKDWIRDRQGVLCEEFAYPTPLANARSRGLNVVPVAMDREGMLAEGPGGLRDVLENWDRSNGRIPHLMYTITVGQNPGSGTLSLDRKRQVYALCQKYDILIMEDDPYWFLQYPSADDLSMKFRGRSAAPKVADYTAEIGGISSGSAFLDSLVPSYISIDVDGRVLRLDTFSKTVAPGCRVGWITAQPAFIECIAGFTDVLTMQPNGFTQSLIAELILGQQLPATANAISLKGGKSSEVNWHMDGWIRWIEGLRSDYERRMQVLSQTCEAGKYKISAQEETQRRSSGWSSDSFEVVSRYQMYDFEFPTGGMFLWMRMQFENHPLFNHPRIPVAKLSLAFFIFLSTVKYRVLIAPGSMFCSAEKIRDEKGPFYYRICFAAIDDSILETVSRNFVQACNDFFDIIDPQTIDDITKDDED